MRKGAGCWQSARGTCAVWVVAILCAALLLTAHELFLRSIGVAPKIEDGKALWSAQRERVYGHANVWVLSGASRMREGFSESTFNTLKPGARAVQLAVGATEGYATLKDLAQDTDFVGTVVFSLHVGSAWIDSAQQNYVAHYHGPWQQNFFARLKFYISAIAGQNLALRASPHLNVLHVLRVRQWPSPPARWHNARRFGGINYALVGDIPQVQPPPPSKVPLKPQQWAEHLSTYYAPLVNKLNARGARVVFVRYPTSGALRAYEAQHYPRPHFWNRVSALTGAPTVHAEDIAPHIATPDGSHMDIKDSPEWTAALVRAIDAL